MIAQPSYGPRDAFRAHNRELARLRSERLALVVLPSLWSPRDHAEAMRLADTSRLILLTVGTLRESALLEARREHLYHLNIGAGELRRLRDSGWTSRDAGMMFDTFAEVLAGALYGRDARADSDQFGDLLEAWLLLTRQADARYLVSVNREPAHRRFGGVKLHDLFALERERTEDDLERPVDLESLRRAGDLEDIIPQRLASRMA